MYKIQMMNMDMLSIINKFHGDSEGMSWKGHCWTGANKECPGTKSSDSGSRLPGFKISFAAWTWTPYLSTVMVGIKCVNMCRTESSTWYINECHVIYLENVTGTLGHIIILFSYFSYLSTYNVEEQYHLWC